MKSLLMLAALATGLAGPALAGEAVPVPAAQSAATAAVLPLLPQQATPSAAGAAEAVTPASATHASGSGCQRGSKSVPLTN